MPSMSVEWSLRGATFGLLLCDYALGGGITLNMSELRKEEGHSRPYLPLIYLICVVKSHK